MPTKTKARRSKSPRAATRVAPAPAATPVITTATNPDIRDADVATLIAWRNSASARIDAADAKIIELKKETKRLEKKRISDAHWAKRLNHILIRKVIKERPHRAE